MSDNTGTAPDDETAAGQNKQSRTDSIWQKILGQFNRAVSDADVVAAAQRVQAKQAAHLDADIDGLVERLIRDKCAQTATIGAVTSGAAIIPGIGTAASLTLGVAADIGATFKLQAELVLEIAAARGRMLSEQEKRSVVMVITGMSSGANQLIGQAGKRATLKITERYAQKWVTHALPFVGIAASAATNVLSTYLVGKRADAYFNLGPEAMGDWGETWRAITGVDERAVGTWFASNARTSWQAIKGSAGQAGATVLGAGKATGSVIASGAGAAAKGTKGGLGAVAKAGRATTRTVGSVTRKVGKLLRRQKDTANPSELNEDAASREDT